MPIIYRAIAHSGRDPSHKSVNLALRRASLILLLRHTGTAGLRSFPGSVHDLIRANATKYGIDTSSINKLKKTAVVQLKAALQRPLVELERRALCLYYCIISHRICRP